MTTIVLDHVVVVIEEFLRATKWSLKQQQPLNHPRMSKKTTTREDLKKPQQQWEPQPEHESIQEASHVANTAPVAAKPMMRAVAVVVVTLER